LIGSVGKIAKLSDTISEKHSSTDDSTDDEPSAGATEGGETAGDDVTAVSATQAGVSVNRLAPEQRPASDRVPAKKEVIYRWFLVVICI